MKRHAFRYPENPGWKDETVSKDNALINRVKFNRMQQRVLNLFESGFVGSTDEVAARLAISVLSARPRCTELLKMDVLERTRIKGKDGQKRWVLALKMDDIDRDLFDGQPDEQQEWHDYDPDC
jgi:hypothetical protein